MMRFTTILASLAQLAALTPITANAQAMPSLNHAQIRVHTTISEPLPEVQCIDANFDAAIAQRPMDQTVVQSYAKQMYPDSVGG
jgi:hypothetical protein